MKNNYKDLSFLQDSEGYPVTWFSLLKHLDGAKYQQHPFIVLGSSRLPVFMGFFVGCLAITLIVKLQNIHDLSKFMFIGAGIMEPFFTSFGAIPSTDLPDSIIDTRLAQCLFFVLLTIWAWAREILKESVIEWRITEEVMVNLAIGMLLFLASEAMLFFPFFWAFFHGSFSPSITVGAVWPPEGINTETLDPFMLPLVNTIVLLTSGLFLVLAHRGIIPTGAKWAVIRGLFVAIMLGILFSWLQYIEYGLTKYTITDGLFGSVFFMLTGLHGFHVVVGTCLLIISYWRAVQNQFSDDGHMMFELSAWYWHFVDVVWLFVFAFVYCWGTDNAFTNWYSDILPSSYMIYGR